MSKQKTAMGQMIEYISERRKQLRKSIQESEGKDQEFNFIRMEKIGMLDGFEIIAKQLQANEERDMMHKAWKEGQEYFSDLSKEKFDMWYKDTYGEK